MPELENFNLDKGIKRKLSTTSSEENLISLASTLLKLDNQKCSRSMLNQVCHSKGSAQEISQFRVHKNSDKDYEKQIDMLRQIAFIKSEIKQDQMQKREREFQALSQRIKIQPLQENEATEIQIDINFQIKIFQEELRNQETIQLHLVKSVLLEQIKLMKNNSISVS